MEQVVDSRQKLAREIAKIAGTIAIAASLIATILFANSPSANLFSSELSSIQELLGSVEDESPPWDDSWVPIGYSAWPDDSNIAWRWVDKSNCDDYGCVFAEFISSNGCPNGLFVDLNWLDPNDSVVSSVSEGLPSLRAQQNAKLRFEDYDGTSDSGQIAAISCG